MEDALHDAALSLSDMADRQLWRVPVVVRQVGGSRAFRRRLMELGLLPGTEVKVIQVAPLGDPLEIEARGCRLSIRHSEARELIVNGPARRKVA